MAESSPKKSTIVRALSQRTMETLAPELVARRVTDRWFRLPAGPGPAAPLPPGGESFVVVWEHGRVRGWTWGEGPIVYLVHGWGGRGDQLSSLVAPLAAMGFRVVLFDGPSHGASDPGAFGPTSTTGVELAKALDAVFTRFGPGEAIVAHSMGAVASLLALDRGWIGVRRLVFLAPMTSYAATMDGLATRLGFGPCVRRRIDALVWRRVGVAPEDFELGNLWARLERPLPTLVVHDTTDRQTSYADARLVAGQIGAELMTTSGLGHNRLLRDQDVIARVARFLRAEVATPLSA